MKLQNYGKDGAIYRHGNVYTIKTPKGEYTGSTVSEALANMNKRPKRVKQPKPSDESSS